VLLGLPAAFGHPDARADGVLAQGAYRSHEGLASSPHEVLDSPRPAGAGDKAGNSTSRGRIEKELNSSDEQTCKQWSLEEWYRSIGVNPSPRPTVAIQSTTLTCAVCGKAGASICATCAQPRKRKYRAAIALAHPQQERDPGPYKRIEQMSRLPLESHTQLWGEFCVEIGAGDFYEYLPILVEIVQEGKWRNASYPMKWLRTTFVRQAKRSEPQDDYYANGKRRTPKAPADSYGKPSGVFDKRSGLLIDYSTRPFVEFGGENEKGDRFSPEDAIDNTVARRNLRTAGGREVDDDGHLMTPPVPADRDTPAWLREKLRKMSLTEVMCAGDATNLLLNDQPSFEKLKAQTMSQQRDLAQRLELDADEAEVLAINILLYADEPRTYMNFVQEGDKKRFRNAWDRFDRRRKKPEFRKILREEARKRRNGPAAATPPKAPVKGPSKFGSRGAFGIPVAVALSWHGQLDRAGGLLLQTPKDDAPREGEGEASRPVELACDLSPEQRALYRASARKKPRPRVKLYSE